MLSNLIGICGAFGNGKTLYGVELGLRLANKFQKTLIVNFSINEKALREYCRITGLRWFYANGRIIKIDVGNDLLKIFERNGNTVNSDSVIVYDEAGIFTNARNWGAMPKEFLRYLNQVRRLNIHLLVIFQYDDQVDKSFRCLFQLWLKCKATGIYDRRLKAPRILARWIFYYTPEKYFKLSENIKAQANMFQPWLHAERVEWRIVWMLQAIYWGRVGLWNLATLVGIKYPQPWQREKLLFAIFNSKELLGVTKAPSKVYTAPYLGLSEGDYQHAQANERELISVTEIIKPWDDVEPVSTTSATTSQPPPPSVPTVRVQRKQYRRNPTSRNYSHNGRG